MSIPIHRNIRYDPGNSHVLQGSIMRALSIILIACSLLLSGCYHQPIQQGNILSPEKTAQIKHGMSKQRVISLLGNPVLRNIYKDNRLVYVYTNQPSRHRMVKSQFIVTFRNNRVVSVASQQH